MAELFHFNISSANFSQSNGILPRGAAKSLGCMHGDQESFENTGRFSF